MKCRVCGKEIEEGSEFCRYCGASQKKKRKPTWSERKRAREKETEEILRKSYITEQDALLAVPTSTEGLEVRLVGDTHGEFKKCVALSVLYGFLTAAALAGLVFFQRVDVLTRTWRALISFAILLFFAGSGAAFAERVYSAKTFGKMMKSVRAVKKVSYGKAPYITNDGKLYQLICDAKCRICGMNMHIEEFDGRLFEVCDVDRTHICVLSTEEIFKNLLGVPEEEFDDGKEKISDPSDKPEEKAVKEDTAGVNQTDTGSDDKICEGKEEKTDSGEDKKDTD